MKNKLAIFLLSAVLALSGTVAISQVNVKAQDKPYSELFTYNDSLTLTANKSAPSYWTNGAVDVNGKTYKTNVGMGFTATADTSFTLNNPIYLGDNSLNTPLIEFVITPKEAIEEHTTSVPSTAKEFDKLVMKLTDVNDPNIYVELMGSFSNTNSNQIWLQVATPTQERAGVNKDILTSEDYKAYGSGMGIQSCFTGESGNIATVYWNNEETAFYAWKSYYNSNLPNKQINVVRDLNDPKHLFAKDTIFTGFTSDFVNVSFRVEGVSAKTASFIIKSIDGQELVYDGEYFKDTLGPSISLNSEFANFIPKGEKGKKYPLFKVDAYDLIDGYDVDTTLIIKDPNGAIVKNGVYNDYFIPAKEGVYTFEYTAKDKSGNSAKVCKADGSVTDTLIVPVEINHVLEDFRLVFTDESQIVHESMVGANIVVPTAKIVGGSGYSYLKTYVVKVDTAEVVSTNSIYSPEHPGWYKIVYEYKDYLGELSMFAIDIDVKLSSKPVFSNISTPVAILSGKNYYIPNVIATDYASFNGEGAVVESEAYVKVDAYDADGNIDLENSFDWKKLDKNYYKPTVKQGKLYLKYKASALLDSEVVAESKVYVMDIVNLSTKKELYKFFNTSKNIETKSVIVNGIDKQTAFYPAKSGETIQFINKLPESGFSATINFDYNYSAIQKLRVVIQDSENANESLTMTFRPGDTNHSYVTISGEEYKIKGSFFSVEEEVGGLLSNTPGRILVKIADGKFYDTLSVVGDVKYYDNGYEFKGFSTGKVYFSVYFDEVNESMVNANKSTSVRFTEFCGTASFAVSGKDEGYPSITLSSELSTYYDVNSYVTLPSAFAVDLFDPDVSVVLTVTDPFGKPIYNGVPTDIERTLHLDKIGQYIVEYTTEDQNGNIGNMQLALYSADTFDPVIEIAGQFKSTAKVTDSYVIHKAIAYDNHDKPEDLVIYVYVFGPDGYIETVAYGPQETKQVEYKFTKLGTYRIRYFVMDSYGNYVHKVFYVKVS